MAVAIERNLDRGVPHHAAERLRIRLGDKIEAFSRDVRGLVKVVVKDDRRGLLDFERYYRIGGQGEFQPLDFERADAHEVGTSGRILEDLREFLRDNDGEPFTKTALRAQVKGSNDEKDKALGALVADHRTAVFADHDRGENLPPYYRHDRARFDRSGKPGLAI